MAATITPVEVTEDNLMGVIVLITKTTDDKAQLARMLSQAHPGQTVYFNDWIILGVLRDALSR